jgi:hypothetical protein
MKNNLFILLVLFFVSINKIISQTSLSPGDIAVIAFKTNSNTDGGNDAIKLVTLVDMQCNTKFIVTDNNWNNATPGWSCNSDEFGVEITCNSIIAAGSVFYIDAGGSGNAATCSGGIITRLDLGGLWGTNYGLSSTGDNIYVLQGTRAAPQFIYALKHNGVFSNTTCSDKDQTGLPTHASLGAYTLAIGATAIVMSSTKDQWNYNCVTNNGSRATILSAISNSANWINNTTHVWDNTNCIFSLTTGIFPYGVLAVSGAGCGCLANCELAYSGGINCGSGGVGGDCGAGYQSMSANITVPAGCTYQVFAQMKSRTYGCGSSGADGNCQGCDNVKVGVLAGAKIFQQGASNSSLSDNYTLAGPGTIRVSGSANRADEIITYSVQVTPCSCLTMILPIELSEFNAKLIDGSVELNWITMSEKKNKYFSIERSSDANLWETIYVIAGQGTSLNKHNYKIYDSSPLSRTSYYRLKQTDNEGSFTYSDIVSVDNNISNVDKKIIKRVNIYGQELENDASGLIILIYNNGEAKKIFK